MKPTFDLVFYSNTVAQGGGVITDHFSCTRSTANFVNAQNANNQTYLVSIPANTLRIGAGWGLLTEETRTNICTYSQDFVAGLAAANIALGGAASSVTFTSNAVTAPDLSNTGIQVTESSTADQHNFKNVTASIAAGNSYFVSVFAKAGTANTFILSGGTSMNTNSWAIFDLANGSISTFGTGIYWVYMRPYANGWYRCGFNPWNSGTIPGGTNGFTVSFNNNLKTYSNSTPSYTGTSKFAYFWGAQVEGSLIANASNQPAPLSSYIPTPAGSSVVRPQDVIITTGNFNSNVVASFNGTLLSETYSFFGSSYSTLIGTSSGPQIFQWYYSQLNSAMGAGNINQNSYNDWGYDAQGISWSSRQCAAYSNNEIMFNGTGNVPVKAGGPIWSSAPTNLTIGEKSDGTENGIGYLHRLSWWNTKLSDSLVYRFTAGTGSNSGVAFNGPASSFWPVTYISEVPRGGINTIVLSDPTAPFPGPVTFQQSATSVISSQELERQYINGKFFNIVLGRLGNLDLDFAGNYVRNDTGSITTYLTNTNASGGLVQNIDGTFTTVAANTLRIGNGTGLLVEQASTNLLPNGTGSGSANGLFNTAASATGPGAIPTNWNIDPDPGLNYVVAGTGTEFGLNYIDIRTYGTTSTKGYYALNYADVGFCLIGAGVPCTFSFYARLISGNTNNFSYPSNIIIHEYTGASAFITQTLNAITLSSTLQRFIQTITTSGTTASVTPGIEFGYNAGMTVDFTLRLYGGQVEQLTFATSLIPTTSVTVTRSADVVTATSTLSTLMSAPAMSALMWVGPCIETIQRTQILFDDSSGNQTLALDNTLGVITHISTGYPEQLVTVSSNTKIGYSTDSTSGTSIVANQSTVTSNTGYYTMGTTPIRIGSGSGAPLAGNFLNRYIQRLTIWNYRLPDSQLQSLTNPNYDTGALSSLVARFFDTFISGGGGATTYQKALMISLGLIVLLSKSIGKKVTNTIGVIVTLLKSISKIFTVPISVIVNLIKSVGKSFTVPIGVIMTMLKSINKIFTAPIGVIVTLLKSISKIFMIPIGVIVSLIKQTKKSFTEVIGLIVNVSSQKALSKAVTNVIALTTNITKAIGKIFTAPIGVIVTLLKNVGKIFTVPIGVIVNLIKQVGKSFTEVIGLIVNVATQKALSKSVTNIIALTTTITKSVGKIFTVPMGVIVTLIKSTSKIFTVPIGVIVTLIKNINKTAFINSIGVIVTLIKSIGKRVTNTFGVTVSLIKGVGKIITTSISQVLLMVKSISKSAFTNVIALTVNITKLKALSIAVLQSTIGLVVNLSMIKSFQRVFTNTIGVIVTLIKSISKIITVPIGVIVNLIKQVGKSFTEVIGLIVKFAEAQGLQGHNVFVTMPIGLVVFLTKNIGKIISNTLGVSVLLSSIKSLGKTFTTTIGLLVNFSKLKALSIAVLKSTVGVIVLVPAKSIGKIITNSIGVIVTTLKNISKIITVPIGVFINLTKNIGKTAFNNTIGLILNFTKLKALSIAVIQSTIGVSVLTPAKAIGKIIINSIGVIVNLTKRIGKLVTVPIGVIVSLVKSAGKTLTTSIGVIDTFKRVYGKFINTSIIMTLTTPQKQIKKIIQVTWNFIANFIKSSNVITNTYNVFVSTQLSAIVGINHLFHKFQEVISKISVWLVKSWANVTLTVSRADVQETVTTSNTTPTLTRVEVKMNPSTSNTSIL